MALSHGEAPDNHQLAAALNVSDEDLAQTVQRMQLRDVSLDQPVATSTEMTYGETLADPTPDAEAQLVSNDLTEKVREKLDVVYEDLSPRERYLLEHRLLSEEPVTLEAAGHEFGVTRERVRQIEERLKGKLRVSLAGAAAL